MDKERRFLPKTEVRIVPSDAGPGKLVGTAAVYDTLSEDLGGFHEIIKPGTFTESLKTADVRCLIDHNSSLLLGRNKSGTLRLLDSATGLNIEDDLPNTSYALDLVAVMGRGDLTGMSFGFHVLEDCWEADAQGRMIRTVTKADIFDVSAVTYPAYVDTKIALRSLGLHKQSAVDPDASRKLRLQFNESLLKSF